NTTIGRKFTILALNQRKAIVMGGWPKGNEYYKLRSKDGKPKKHTPESLAEAFDKYSDFVHGTPFKEEQLFHYQGMITKGEAKKMRPMTLEGFCNFAGITLPTFRDYASQSDYSSVT